MPIMNRTRSNSLRFRRSLVAGHWPLIPLFLALILLVVGCQSAQQPGSTSHASVQIQGRSVAEIQATAAIVFREEGYALTLTTRREMVFERPGTRWDAAKWGGWSGQGVTMRVKVQLSQQVNGGQLLQADAYAVQNSDDPFFQNESRNILVNRHPYQKLLEQVAKRLK